MPLWLKFGSRGQVWSVCGSLVYVCKTRAVQSREIHSMVRRGWQQLDVPTGWVQIPRGPLSHSGEVASGNEERSGDTKHWRRSLAAKFSTRRSSQTFWESTVLNPDRGLGCSASLGVPAVEARVGRFGESQDSTEAQILRDALRTGTTFSTGAAYQRTDEGHRRVHREVNKQAPSVWCRNAARRSNCWRMPQPGWPGCASWRQVHQCVIQQHWTCKSPS